jgi:hypothetical protein
LKAAEKNIPHAHDTFMTNADDMIVITNAKTVGRKAASQYAIMMNIKGSTIKPGS